MNEAFREDGERLAKLIYQKLLESETGKIGHAEISSVYDNLDFPLLRKSEWFTWKWIDEKEDVERYQCEGKTGRYCLRLLEPD